MTLRAGITMLGLVSLLASPSLAAVRRVPLDFPTITAALASTAPGDTVLVSAGTYSSSTNGETFPLQLAFDGIRLLGAGMDATVLDAQGTGSVIRHAAAVGGRISGFRITGGSGSQGGGVDIVNGNVEVDHNRIERNGASIGGAGLSARNASAPWIHHNLILDNFATSSADVHGVRLNQRVAGVFEHNLVAHTDGNGLLTVDSVATIVRHNIFYQNGIPVPLRGRGICWLSNAHASISHNLFFQNQVAALLWLEAGMDLTGTAANGVAPADGVYGNLDLDPLFVNPGAGDYHLQSGSPAIDAGDPTLPHDPDGTIADIGPFAYPQVVAAPPARRATITLLAAPNPVSTGTDVHFGLPALAHVQVEVLDSSGRLLRRLDGGSREAGTHVLRWDGSDGAGRTLSPGVYYVRVRAGELMRTLRVSLIR